MKKILEIQNFLATRFVRLVLAGLTGFREYISLLVELEKEYKKETMTKASRSVIF